MDEKVATRRWWVAPAALAALLIVAAVVGGIRPGNFVVLGWLDRPFVFGVLAFLLSALAFWLALRDRVARVVLAVVLVVCAGIWGAFGSLATALGDDLKELSRHRSPGGSHELVLYRGYNVIDPTWELRLRSGSGLTTREWDLGCVNGDAENLTAIEWTGPDELRVNLAIRGEMDIALEPATGRPRTTLSVGC